MSWGSASSGKKNPRGGKQIVELNALEQMATECQQVMRIAVSDKDYKAIGISSITGCLKRLETRLKPAVAIATDQDAMETHARATRATTLIGKLRKMKDITQVFLTIFKATSATNSDKVEWVGLSSSLAEAQGLGLSLAPGALEKSLRVQCSDVLERSAYDDTTSCLECGGAPGPSLDADILSISCLSPDQAGKVRSRILKDLISGYMKADDTKANGQAFDLIRKLASMKYESGSPFGKVLANLSVLSSCSTSGVDDSRKEVVEAARAEVRADEMFGQVWDVYPGFVACSATVATYLKVCEANLVARNALKKLLDQKPKNDTVGKNETHAKCSEAIRTWRPLMVDFQGLLGTASESFNDMRKDDLDKFEKACDAFRAFVLDRSLHIFWTHLSNCINQLVESLNSRGQMVARR